MENLAEQLDEALAELGITRYRLSQLTEIPHSTISTTASGQTRLSANVAARFERVGLPGRAWFIKQAERDFERADRALDG